MNEDMKLVEISKAELPKLRELYKKDWPKFINGYHTIDTFIRWNDDSAEMRVYGLEGSWEKDGSFIAREKFYVFMDTLDENSDSLKIILHLANLSHGHFISCFSQRIRPIIMGVVRDLEFDTYFDSGTYSYYMSKEDALKFEETSLEGITLKSLLPENAEQMNNIWPHRRGDSKAYLERIIRNDYSLGAFKHDGELVAWCVRLHMGSLGLLQVEEKYYRKGYGALVAKEISRMFAKNGYDITSNIVVGNVKSINLFEKIGFKKIDNNFWIMLKSPEGK